MSPTGLIGFVRYSPRPDIRGPGRLPARYRVTQKRDDMHFGIYKNTWYCRWCGHTYRPLKDTDRDGFCSPACKMAHHRAYKKYIEWKLLRKKTIEKKNTGGRRKSNAKKRRFKRPVRVKFYTKPKRQGRKLNLP